MVLLRKLGRVRWLATLLGALSGALVGFGIEFILTQGGHLDPSRLGIGILVGLSAGALVGFLRIPRNAQRIIKIVATALAIGGIVVSVIRPTPAYAQGACGVEIAVGDARPSLAGNAVGSPLVVDLTEPVDVRFQVNTTGVTRGAFELSVQSVEAGVFIPRDGDLVLHYGPVSGDSAEGVVSFEPSGASGFTATFDGYQSPMLPFGTLQTTATVTSFDGQAPQVICAQDLWVRAVARPIGNLPGQVALGCAMVGLAGMAGASAMGSPTGRRGPRIVDTSDGPFIEAGGLHVPHVETQLMRDGVAVDPDLPLVGGEQYDVRVTLLPGGGGVGTTPVQVSTAGELAGGDTLTVELGAEPISMDFPLDATEVGRSSVSVDVTAKGNLLQSEKVHASVVAGDGVAAAPAETETTFSIGDLSVDEIKIRDQRALLVILESDQVDQTVDVRIRGTDGKRLVAFDSPLPPAAISKAAQRGRDALRDVLDGGPGKSAAVNDATFGAAMLALAAVGRHLFMALLPEKRVVDGDPALVEAAVGEGVTVQVVQNKSGLGYTTLPWALVYDRPFVQRATSTVCDSFRAHLVDDCPHRSDHSTVCPTGFWGYRAMLEEPWIATTDKVAVSPVRPLEGGGLALAYLLEELSGTARQADDLARAGVFRVNDLGELLDVLNERSKQVEFVYFYTHHLNDTPVGPALEIENEQLSALTFDALNQEWTRRPVVMINACGSGGYSLTDSMSLVEAFRFEGASGLITTECELWDPFAGQLATRIIDDLRGGKTLGAALLELRRDLLRDHNNPVGFAYRLHARADSKVRIGGSAT